MSQNLDLPGTSVFPSAINANICQELGLAITIYWGFTTCLAQFIHNKDPIR